jgi:hypothetical protein
MLSAPTRWAGHCRQPRPAPRRCRQASGQLTSRRRLRGARSARGEPRRAFAQYGLGSPDRCRSKGVPTSVSTRAANRFARSASRHRAQIGLGGAKSASRSHDHPHSVGGERRPQRIVPRDAGGERCLKRASVDRTRQGQRHTFVVAGVDLRIDRNCREDLALSGRGRHLDRPRPGQHACRDFSLTARSEGGAARPAARTVMGDGITPRQQTAARISSAESFTASMTWSMSDSSCAAVT